MQDLVRYMKLLKWTSIYGDKYWDISTSALEDLAYKELFSMMETDKRYAYIEANLEEAQISRADLHLLREHLKLSGFKFKSSLLKTKFNEWVSDREIDAGAGSNYQFERQAELYLEAKTGSIDSMRKLIHLRSDQDYEYETVRIVKI